MPHHSRELTQLLVAFVYSSGNLAESEIYSTLRALVAETPSPSETLMKTWAKLLHLELSELQAMINLLDLHELDPQPPTSTPSPDGQRSLITLPPIYHSPSPEPAAIVAHSSPQLSPQTPLKIKVIIQSHPFRNLPHNKGQLPSPQEIHRTALLLQIGEGMEAAVTRKSPSSLSRAQFNDLFAPYEFRMRYILDEVGNGAFKNQGWTPCTALKLIPGLS